MTDDSAVAPRILDGAALARARLPALAVRSEAVFQARGTPPTLVLVAFADESGQAPWVDRKLRAAARAGVRVVPLILPASTRTAGARRALDDVVAGEAPDAVFLEFPFPAGVDGDAVSEAIPPAADIDVMHPATVRRYLTEPTAPPPLTVAAALELLDAGAVPLDGRHGTVVGEDIPFHAMFRLALERRGAIMAPLAPPDAPDLQARLDNADLVVLSAGSPGLVPARWLEPGAVVVDAGYFNPGGRGDLDTDEGVGHLRALAPVPGGVGPMTVSVLLERVVERAEGSLRAGGRRADGHGS